jgi:hypothetical protein
VQFGVPPGWILPTSSQPGACGSIAHAQHQPGFARASSGAVLPANAAQNKCNLPENLIVFPRNVGLSLRLIKKK